MCKVKSGAAIKNQQDVQNLVIGIINRQQECYNKKQIYDAVMYYFHGASINMREDAVDTIIEENLAFLYRKGLIDCRNGYYSPQSI